MEAGDERAGKTFGVRLRLGDDHEPPLEQAAIELSFEEVASGKGSLAWCQSQGARARGRARRLLEAEAAPPAGRTG